MINLFVFLLLQVHNGCLNEIKGAHLPKEYLFSYYTILQGFPYALMELY